MEKCSLYHICREADVGNLEVGYIGITNNLQRRWRDHREGHSKCAHVNHAIQKYDDIVYSVIEEGSREDMLELESTLRPEERIGWNIAPGGKSGYTGVALSGEDHWTYGIPRPEETRRKISEKLKGNIISEEARLKISKAHKGRVVSEDTKDKIRGIKNPNWKGGCIINDTLYTTFMEAAKDLGFKSHSAIIHRIKNDNFPNDRFVPKEEYLKLIEEVKPS